MWIISSDCSGKWCGYISWTSEPNALHRNIFAFTDHYHLQRLNGAMDGVQMLKDLRWLESEFGVGEAFEYSWRFYDFEQFAIMVPEFRLAFTLSLGAVLTVILIISSNLATTIIVAISVLTTNVFLIGLVYYWDLTLNPMVLLNIMLSIGTSIDFSAHIAYSYLTEICPEGRQYNTPSKIRNFKA